MYTFSLILALSAAPDDHNKTKGRMRRVESMARSVWLLLLLLLLLLLGEEDGRHPPALASYLLLQFVQSELAISSTKISLEEVDELKGKSKY